MPVFYQLYLHDRNIIEETGTYAFCSPIAALPNSCTQIDNHSKLHNLTLWLNPLPSWVDQNDCPWLSRGVLYPDPGADSGRGADAAVHDWIELITVIRGFGNWWGGIRRRSDASWIVSFYLCLYNWVLGGEARRTAVLGRGSGTKEGHTLPNNFL